MRWYAVHTRPAAEATAMAHLRRQGYAAYLPRHRRWVRHARKEAQVLRPLFPRYLFVAIDRAATSWRPVLSTIGVAGMVCGGDQPLAVGDEIIALLRRREDEGGFDEPAAASRLQPGDRVRVHDGPFADLVGRLGEASAHERVSVLFEFLGRTVRAELPAASLEAA